MLILNLIENYLSKLNVIKRIILYSLPLLLFTIWFNSLPKTQKAIQLNQEVPVIKKKIKELNTKISSKPNMFTLITRIETFAKTNNTIIKSLKHEQGLYHIEFITAKQKVYSVLNFCEYVSAFSKIKYLRVFLNQKESTISMKLSFDNYYHKKKRPTIEQMYRSKNNNSLELKAIIDHYVLINNQWITVNDTIENYKVRKISMNSVVLTNKNKTLVLELFDETK